MQKKRDAEFCGRILVVDDEESILQIWKMALKGRGHKVFLFENSLDVLPFLEDHSIDVVLLDHMMPYMTGLDLLTRMKEKYPKIEVVMMTGYASVETALSAMKIGAYDYLQKPFEQIEIAIRVVENALERKCLLDRTQALQKRLENSEKFEGMIGSSLKMRKVFLLIEQVATFDAAVLISGETGTGKEQVARAIHAKSHRAKKSFVPVVCGALSESLIESTLFGHRKGSFTGAFHDQMGLIEAASGGTLFLDEVGDIPLSIQVKLLRVLQEGEVQRLGDTEPTQVDIRLISATHRNLQKGISAGSFREDLFFRLNTIEIVLPPLKDRRDDISLLAYHFLSMYRTRFNKPIKRISPEVLNLLRQYRWPGNVRELEHMITRALILEMGDELSLSSLPEQLHSISPMLENAQDLRFLELNFRDAKKMLVQDFERRYLRNALAKAKNNISQAARLAGMDRSNFRRLLRRYKVQTNSSKY